MGKPAKTHAIVEFLGNGQFEVVSTHTHSDAVKELEKLRSTKEGIEAYNYGLVPYVQKQPLFPPNAELRRYENGDSQ